jgi:hypothetical protein
MPWAPVKIWVRRGRTEEFLTGEAANKNLRTAEGAKKVLAVNLLAKKNIKVE